MPVDKTTNTEAQVHVVELQTGSTEHNDVLKVFHKTMPQGTAYKNIVKIQRIQNPTLYAQYIAKKKAMDKHMPGRQNELQLFHGTTGDNCSKINMTSFNRSFAGQNGNNDFLRVWHRFIECMCLYYLHNYYSTLWPQDIN